MHAEYIYVEGLTISGLGAIIIKPIGSYII